MFYCALYLLTKWPFATLLPNMTKQTQQLVLMLVIGVLIGTTGVMAWKTRHMGALEEAVNSTPKGATTSQESLMPSRSTIAGAPGLPAAPQIPENSRVGLTVKDQIAGTKVDVEGLTLTDNHWVAVYDDQEGHPGWIHGAARVHTGDTTAQIEMLRAIEAGSKYYVAILGDDGDDTFNRLTDLPPLTPDKVVIVSFKAK